MTRLRKPRRKLTGSIAQRLTTGAETARSDRTHRRYVKALRDTALRSCVTGLLAIPGTASPVQILEMPDHSCATLTRTSRSGRPHRASHLTGDDRQMAQELLDRLQNPPQTEEPCCDQPHPPGHCHRLLPKGATCWHCTQAA